jgi:glycosyltransferase involved in cell wall biosynthesis
MKELPLISLKIAGSGPMDKAVRAYITNEKLHNVELLGYKSGRELATLIARAQFAVVPSEWYENNPMSIIEAYNAGTPVIGANIGGIPEIVTNGTGVLLSPNPAASEIRGALVDFYRLPREAKDAMRNAARLLWEQEYNAAANYRKFAV